MKLILISITLFISQAIPIVVFHGMGDACENEGMASFTEQIGGDCIEIGNGSGTSIGTDFKEQAEEACEHVATKYRGLAIHAVGLSQGALLARYIATDCEFDGHVVKLLSIGGPNMGVSKIPRCELGLVCAPINWMVKLDIYSVFVQNNVGPAGYFRDNKHLEKYREKSHFLPDANNERTPSQYRKGRFTALEGVMLVKFTEDAMIHPKETSFFEGEDPEGNIIPLKESAFYINDLIGLRQLDEEGKVTFIEIEGDHLKFSELDIKNLFIPFLNGNSID